jgi:uroporphyrin-III C-methyltransferase/precorrin-2 dehydrogenase/sirohydrochlorin ferrochelatase/uroporphyrin-III C-methyltransferase
MEVDRSAKVHLVGAGPGDPELLTVKALCLVEEADVVAFDRLVAPEILDLVPPGTSRINAGKAMASHSLAQDGINALLMRLARSGRSVVRLKVGDRVRVGRA